MSEIEIAQTLKRRENKSKAQKTIWKDNSQHFSLCFMVFSPKTSRELLATFLCNTSVD